MEVILREDVPHLGTIGDIVKVRPGYARNYLLPHHMALLPNKGNMKGIEEDKKRAAEVRARKRALLVELAERLKGAEVTISAASTPDGHLYGSVGPREISRALLDEGHSVHADQIKMSHNIKEIGTLEVSIMLADDLAAAVKVWVVREKSAAEVDEEPTEKDVNDGADENAAHTYDADAIDE